jgi:DNA mismatch repair protein MutS2
LGREVVEEARAFVGPEQAQVDSLLTDIRRERDEAASARRSEEIARREAEEIRARLDERLERIESERETLVERTAGELERDTEAVRELLAQAERDAERGRLQRAAEKLTQAQERAKQVEQRRPPKRPKAKPKTPAGPPPESIEAGDLVWIAGYDRFGEALGPPDDRGEVELKLGPLRSRVRLAQVERVQRPHLKGQGSGVRGHGSRFSEEERPSLPEVEAPPVEIEIRGQTVDEALPRIDQYLDQAYRAGLPWVRIIHGRGTGTLRRQVRDVLQKHPLVRSYETAPREHGGEGVTVVTLVE